MALKRPIGSMTRFQWKTPCKRIDDVRRLVPKCSQRKCVEDELQLISKKFTFVQLFGGLDASNA